jgi:hypothetical protein
MGDEYIGKLYTSLPRSCVPIWYGLKLPSVQRRVTLHAHSHLALWPVSQPGSNKFLNFIGHHILLVSVPKCSCKVLSKHPSYCDFTACHIGYTPPPRHLPRLMDEPHSSSLDRASHPGKIAKKGNIDPESKA